MNITAKRYEELRSAAGLEGDRAVIRLRTTYQPAGGPAARVFPPTFGNTETPYLKEPRVVGGATREAVLLDSVPSQANRAEIALLKAVRSKRVQLPLMEIHHQGTVPITISSLELPHRYADAYLRDSEIDGIKFDKSELGQALQASTTEDVSALYRHDPGSLVFGAWNSHRKGRQAKFPRIYSSEVFGWDPEDGRRSSGRMDPMNLTGSAEADGDSWKFAPVGTKVKGSKLSERGLGNIAPNETHGGVTIESAERIASISLAGLDRLGFGDVSYDASVAGRTALAAYALLADRLAFGGAALWLRSGCELVVTDDTCSWVSRGGGIDDFACTTAEAIELFQHAVGEAESHGLAMSFDVVGLTPSKNLAAAIEFALTKAADTDEG